MSTLLKLFFVSNHGLTLWPERKALGHAGFHMAGKTPDPDVLRLPYRLKYREDHDELRNSSSGISSTETDDSDDSV